MTNEYVMPMLSLKYRPVVRRAMPDNYTVSYEYTNHELYEDKAGRTVYDGEGVELLVDNLLYALLNAEDDDPHSNMSFSTLVLLLQTDAEFIIFGGEAW